MVDEYAGNQEEIKQESAGWNAEWQIPLELLIQPQVELPLSQWKTVDKLLKLPVTKVAIDGYKQVKHYAPRTMSWFEYGAWASSRPCRYIARQVLEKMPERAGAVCFVLNFKACDRVSDTHWPAVQLFTI